MDNKMIERMIDRVNNNEWLAYRGRFVDVTFLLESGDDAWLVTIAQGRITRAQPGPFVMPRWTFALRADKTSWAYFVRHQPPPGFHDLMAMIKFKTLHALGDQHVFIANLLYFKELFANARTLESVQ